MSAANSKTESVFWSAVAIESPAERARYLDDACGGDAQLRAQIEELLAAYPKAEKFLEPSAGGTVDQPPAESPGTVIGPYKLLQQIGEGGMGTVFMAEQTEPVQRKVALKIIKPGMDSRQVIARFEQERQALAMMDHPHIAKVLDAGTTETGRPYFVMELVKGIPITKYCDQEHLTPKERLELFMPVCQAVQHAHQKGIIHRDLKPSNVLIAMYDGKPVPKIIDFGVAKATAQKLTERTMFTEVGQIVGTLEYMAPEQAELNNLDIDTRADIYSLGVILYELLAGSTPFTRKQLQSAAFTEMLRMIREVEPPKPSTKLSTAEELPAIAANRKLDPKKLTKLVHGDLDWIAMKCLEKERNRRYESANGLALEIQRFLADEPVQAGPPTARYRLRKFLRRNRGPVLAATLVALALLTGTTVSIWQAVRATRAEGDAVTGWAAEAERRQDAVTAQREAELQASIARAVNDFLQTDLLGQAYVGNQPLLGRAVDRDPKITVGELLDRAARGIEGKFADQPLTEASIRLTIGDTYRELGRLTESQPHVERSVQLRTDQLGAEHADTLSSKNNLAMLYQLQGKYDQAERLFKEVRDARTALLGTNHPDTLTSKHNLACLYRDLGKYDLAEVLFIEVLAARIAVLAHDHRDTLATKHNLALLYHYQSKYPQAEALYREVLTVSSGKLGADHPQTVHTKLNLAGLYYSQGKYDPAEALFKEVLAAYTAKLGADHPATLLGKQSLAMLYKAQAKYELAEKLYREVLAAQTVRLGADHNHTQITKQGLARLFQAQGKYDQAETLSKEVVDTVTAQLGPSHPDTLASKNNLAGLYQHQEKYAQAEALQKEVLAAEIASLGPDHPHTLTSKHNLGVLYAAQGKFDEAAPLFEEALAARTAKLGADHPNTLLSKQCLGGVYRDQKKYAQAEALLKEVVASQTAKLGGEHPAALDTKRLLAGLYQAQGKYDQALPMRREALDGVRKKLGMAHPTTQSYVRSLIDCYEQMGQPANGEPLVRELADFWKQKTGADSPAYAGQLAALGQNLLRQKKYAEAEPVLRDSLKIREQKQPEEWTTLNTKSLLGGALLGQKKFADAEPLLVQGYEAMKQRADKIPASVRTIRLTESLQRLVELYDGWGKKDEADKWRKKLEAQK